MTGERQPGTMNAVTTTLTAVAETATDAAGVAAARSRVDVRLLHDLADLEAVYTLFDHIWKPDPANPPVTIEQLRAMTHAGNYVAGAYVDGGGLVGGCVGFFAEPVGVSMHSHVAGVAESARGRSVGFALKVHQRAWALRHGLAEVTWTFDPLIRRNAYFNLVKLAAMPREYLVDFYGDVDDSINAGQGSDRLLVAWDLAASGVVDACAGRRAEPGPDRLVHAYPALLESRFGRPQAGAASRLRAASTAIVQVPADIEALRRSDPGTALEWRLAVRDVLGGLIADGARVTGFSRSGWYVLERAA